MQKSKTGGMIFDMDGTILDSMQVWENLGKDYLKAQGEEPPSDFNEIIRDMTLDESVSYMKKKFNIVKATDVIIDEIIKMISDSYEFTIESKPGMVDRIREYKEQGVRMCILTTSDYKCTVNAMKRIGLLDCFEQIFTSDSMGMSKRYPDIYACTCKKMGFVPEETTVYEDILYGIKSAKAAGCHTVGVYDKSSDSDWNSIKEIADEVIVC